MAEARKGKLMSSDRCKVVAKVDNFSPVTLNGKRYTKTVRVSSCELLTYRNKCAACVSYQDSLRMIYHRWCKQRSLSPSHRLSTKSKINTRWLSIPEKVKRYTKLRTRLDAKSKEVKHLREKIIELKEKNHILLDSTLQSDFEIIMSDLTDSIHEETPNPL